MTIAQRSLWNDGKILWCEYVKLNDYAFNPTIEGIKKLSKLLDLNVNYLMERITFYLEN